MSDAPPNPEEPTPEGSRADHRPPKPGSEPADAERQSNADQVEQLVFDCLEAPDPDAALDNLARRHPQLAPQLRATMAQLREWDLVGKTLPADRLADSLEAIPERLGPFRLLRRIGAGGMGVVFLARDDELGRTVALKLIRPEQVFFPGARERFQREVETVARLQHGGIVPVYTVGKHDGIPYFTMEHIEGCSLADAIAELRGADDNASGDTNRLHPNETLGGDRLLSAIARRAPSAEASGSSSGTSDRLRGRDWPTTCVEVISQVASALHHAHERGVLHRDIKPSNILLSLDGQARLVDFGLAWNDAHDQRLTQSRNQLGSLPYLPPEQLTDTGHQPSRLGDVYALGVTLYEMLTLTNPFLGAGVDETRRRILEANPTAPRRLLPQISWELETVCMVAMDRDPAQRYPNAVELQRELERIRDHVPIEARRPGIALQARRWTQRHPTLAAILAVGGILLGLGFSIFGIRERNARVQADRLSAAAEDERYSALLSTANLELAEGLRPGETRRLLERCRPEDRGWEWQHLEFASDESTHVLDALGGSLETLAWSPDGRLATGTHDGTLRIWSDQGEELMHLESQFVSAIRFISAPSTSGINGALITGTLEGKLQMRDSTTGALLATFASADPDTGQDAAPQGQIVGIAHTATDPNTLYSCGSDGRIVIWDLAKRSYVADLGRHKLPVQCLALSSDGTQLASGGFDRKVKVFNLKSRTQVFEKTLASWIQGVAFAPSGTRLYAADQEALRVVDIALSDQPVDQTSGAGGPAPTTDPTDGTKFLDREHRGAMALAVSPDGTRVGAILDRRALHLYAVADNDQLVKVMRLVGHEGVVQRIAFHPDGERLATGGSEPVVRLWHPDYRAATGCRPHRRMVVTMATTGPNTVVSCDSAGTLVRTNLADRSSTVLREGQPRVVGIGAWPGHSILLSPPESFTVDSSGQIQFWTPTKDTPIRTVQFDPSSATVPAINDPALSGGPAEVEVTAAVQAGRTLVLGDSAGRISIIDATSGKVLTQWSAHDGHVTTLLTDGTSLWSGGVDGAVRQWKIDTGAAVRELFHNPHWIPAAVLSPNGDWLAASCADTLVRVFDAGTGEVLHTLEGHGRAPLALAVTADGDRLVSSGGYDQEIRFWDPRKGRLLLSVPAPRAVTAMAMSQDGQRLVMGNRVGEIRWKRARPAGPRAARRKEVAPDLVTSPPGRNRVPR